MKPVVDVSSSFVNVMPMLVEVRYDTMTVYVSCGSVFDEYVIVSSGMLFWRVATSDSIDVTLSVIDVSS